MLTAAAQLGAPCGSSLKFAITPFAQKAATAAAIPNGNRAVPYVANTAAIPSPISRTITLRDYHRRPLITGALHGNRLGSRYVMRQRQWSDGRPNSLLCVAEPKVSWCCNRRRVLSAGCSTIRDGHNPVSTERGQGHTRWAASVTVRSLARASFAHPDCLTAPRGRGAEICCGWNGQCRRKNECRPLTGSTLNLHPHF